MLVWGRVHISDKIDPITPVSSEFLDEAPACLPELSEALTRGRVSVIPKLFHILGYAFVWDRESKHVV